MRRLPKPTRGHALLTPRTALWASIVRRLRLARGPTLRIHDHRRLAHAGTSSAKSVQIVTSSRTLTPFSSSNGNPISSSGRPIVGIV